VWLFDSKQNVSSSGAQGKQSSNCAVGQQRPVLGNIPAFRVWLKLKLVCHLAEQFTLKIDQNGAFFPKKHTR